MQNTGKPTVHNTRALANLAAWHAQRIAEATTAKAKTGHKTAVRLEAKRAAIAEMLKSRARNLATCEFVTDPKTTAPEWL
jgi:hypothetical protein